MKPRIIQTILRKELLDTLRDKRTLILMFGVPILLYPVMMLVGFQVAMVHQGRLQHEVSRVAVVDEEDSILREWLGGEEKIEIVETEDPDAALAQRELDAVIVAEPGLRAAVEGDESARVQVRYDATEFSAGNAADRVRDILEKEEKEIVEGRLNRAHLSEHYVHPLQVERVNTAPPEKTTGTLLGLLLPLVMVLMITMGAFNPAVDLTAGEKERGTFESLLSTPATKTEIVFGKFAVIFTLSMLSGLLNLASMAVTFVFLLNQLQYFIGDSLPFTVHLPLHSFLVVMIVIIPLSLFISAATMSLAVLARSFKEAQYYLTPFLLIIIFPAMMAGLPTVELSAANQFVPVANVVLLFRAIMTGKAGGEAVFAVFFSTAVFALLALVFAAWLFQREEVILSEERGLPLSLRRSDFPARNALTPSAALTWFAVQTLLLFYVGGLLQQWHLFGGLLATEYGLILTLTLGLLWFVRTDLRKALHLAPLAPRHLFAGLLTGIGAIVLVIQIGVWQNQFAPTPEGLKEALTGIFSGGESLPGFLWLLFVLALSPAICEEILFRGAILSGLRTRLHPWAAILLTGALFGLFHISVYRILSTGLLGVVLSYLVVRSGSIYLSMIVHALVNGTAILIVSGHAPKILFRLLDLEQIERNGLPLWFVGVGAATFGAGVFWMEVAARPRSKDAD